MNECISAELDESTRVELGGLLGFKMARFLMSCDELHPELLVDPFADAIRIAKEFAEVSRFCLSRGICDPVVCMRKCPPRNWPPSIFRPRFLKDPLRSRIRSMKRSTSMDSPSFARMFARYSTDLPRDFSHLKEGAFSNYCELWDNSRRTLNSAGCIKLANKAAELAGNLNPAFMGFSAVSISLASMVLCKRAEAKVSGKTPKDFLVDSEGHRLSPTISRVDFISDVGCIPEGVFLSETIMDGRPAFDHHLVVSSPNGRLFLGERDGVCYLTGENYF